MRRMYSFKPIPLPNESNLVGCSQFVADSIVFNNVKPGLYIVQLANTADNVSYGYQLVRVKHGHEVRTASFINVYGEAVCVALQCNKDTKTITIQLVDSAGIVQSPSDYHIDLFKAE